MELSLGCLGVGNEPNPVEIGVADHEGAGEAGGADAADGEDDSGRVVVHREGAGATLRESAVGGDPKEG